jgi:hypothetical protein
LLEYLLIVVLLIIVISFLTPAFLGAPWVPTAMDNVRKTLSIAEVKPNEVVYDLGSGDGRFIIAAAKEFHARSVGIEANPLWVLWTHGQIFLSNLVGRVRISWGNFHQMRLSEADVVILYLLQGTNNKLKKKLETELKPGARVVSHYFTFLDWRPIKTDSSSHIYLYEIGNHRYPS